jgi:dihydroxyacetone kinase/dihydroxyacetone kinase-like protein
MSQPKDVEAYVRLIAETAVENEKYFSELDGVVGDGDFGTSLATGFGKVLAGWDQLDHSSPGAFLRKVSTTIVGSVGGVTGTLWGTAFLRAGMVLGAKAEADIHYEDVIAMFRSAIEGMKTRGQSDLGDKTLLDALIPAVDHLEQSFKEGKDTASAVTDAATVARKQAEDTRPMIAKRGRASYTGERSIGTLDAGAVAIAVMFEKVSDAMKS